LPEVAGADLADDFEVRVRGPIGGAEGETVSGGTVEGGLIAVGQNGLSEDAGAGLEERSFFGFGWARNGASAGQHDFERFFKVDDMVWCRSHCALSGGTPPPLSFSLKCFESIR
jgi:hypothetical protein